MANKCFYTIGYGKSKREEFIAKLIKYRVKYLVDVRSSPKSSHNHDYDKESLENELKKNGISYEWLGDYIGGRSSNDELFVNNVISYEKLVETEKFKKGLELLKEIVAQNDVCIMCSEWNPMDCHRFMAISKKLSEEGYRIEHILSNGKHIKQENLELKLISLYYSDNRQISLFDNDAVDEREESYKKHNVLKGYKKEYKNQKDKK